MSRERLRMESQLSARMQKKNKKQQQRRRREKLINVKSNPKKRKQMKKVIRKRKAKQKEELKSAQWKGSRLQYQLRSQCQTSPRSLIANR